MKLWICTINDLCWNWESKPKFNGNKIEIYRNWKWKGKKKRKPNRCNDCERDFIKWGMVKIGTCISILFSCNVFIEHLARLVACSDTKQLRKKKNRRRKTTYTESYRILRNIRRSNVVSYKCVKNGSYRISLGKFHGPIQMSHPNPFVWDDNIFLKSFPWYFFNNVSLYKGSNVNTQKLDTRSWMFNINVV